MAKKKKQSMIKDAIILCMISLIAALALGFVNELTKDRIALLEAQAKAEAYKEVFPEADAIVDAENNDVLANALEEAGAILANGGFSNVTLNEVCLVNDASGNHIGYVASVTLKAYDVMTLTFGYTTDGTVTGLAFLSIKETPGIGMKADEPAFKSQFAGNKADKLVSVKSGAGEGEINAISGATFTTDGVIKGVNAGICFMKELQTRLGGAN
jgi:electron transport complex protein RnfG